MLATKKHVGDIYQHVDDIFNKSINEFWGTNIGH